jgi:hypothetical protein
VLAQRCVAPFVTAATMPSSVSGKLQSESWVGLGFEVGVTTEMDDGEDWDWVDWERVKAMSALESR